MVGTPYYISPELCKGEPYTFNTDVWALGCILHEMVFLRICFNGMSLLKISEAIVNNPHNSNYPKNYSKELGNLIDQMLIKDPRKRPNID